MLLFRVIKERETAHEVRRTSVLRGPKPTSCGLRPRTWYEF